MSGKMSEGKLDIAKKHLAPIISEVFILKDFNGNEKNKSMQSPVGSQGDRSGLEHLRVDTHTDLSS